MDGMTTMYNMVMNNDYNRYIARTRYVYTRVHMLYV